MATARPLVLLAAVLLPGSASGGPARARLLQDGCGCAQCVQKGNAVADCEGFGLDCGCYDSCPCATCVGTKGNTVADCESFGLDCGCYADDGGACGGGSRRAAGARALERRSGGTGGAVREGRP